MAGWMRPGASCGLRHVNIHTQHESFLYEALVGVIVIFFFFCSFGLFCHFLPGAAGKRWARRDGRWGGGWLEQLDQMLLLTPTRNRGRRLASNREGGYEREG